MEKSAHRHAWIASITRILHYCEAAGLFDGNEPLCPVATAPGLNFPYTDDFDIPYVSFRINLDAPPQRPFIRKALVMCLPGVRSGGRFA